VIVRMVYSPLADEWFESRISLQEEYTVPPVVPEPSHPVAAKQSNQMNEYLFL